MNALSTLTLAVGLLAASGPPIPTHHAPAGDQTRREGPPLPPHLATLSPRRVSPLEPPRSPQAAQVGPALRPGATGNAVPLVSRRPTAMDYTTNLLDNSDEPAKVMGGLALRATLLGIALGLGASQGSRPAIWPERLGYPPPTAAPATLGVSLAALTILVIWDVVAVD